MSLFLNPGDVVSSGVLTTAVGENAGIVARRQGALHLDFGRGPCNYVPWDQIAVINVYENRGEFVLKNGMSASHYHDPSRDDYGNVVNAEWYIKLEGMLLLWVRQSEATAKLTDGRVVYELETPPVVFHCATVKDVAWKSQDKAIHAGGRVILPEQNKTLGTKKEMWEEIKTIQQKKLAKYQEVQKPEALPNTYTTPPKEEYILDGDYAALFD